MFEVIINGRTVLATEKREQACALFDFYRKEKRLLNISTRFKNLLNII